MQRVSLWTCDLCGATDTRPLPTHDSMAAFAGPLVPTVKMVQLIWGSDIENTTLREEVWCTNCIERLRNE
jgi:hypothetical protein